MKFAKAIKRIEVLALSTALLSSSVWNIGVEAQRKLKGEFGTQRLQRELMGSSKSSKMKTSSSLMEEENMDLAECPERIVESSPSKSKSKDVKEVCPNEGIIITEIMYNPEILADSVGEWIEILNYGCTDVDLTGWDIDDGQERDALTLTCGADAVLSPGEYALIIQGGTNGQVLTFYGGAIPDGTKVFSTLDDDIGNMLGNEGNDVMLFDSNGTEIQRFVYDDGGRCGTAADGKGYSLERAWPDRTPECGNFISSEVKSLKFPKNGTPGRQNNIWFGRSSNVFDECECTVE